MIEYPQCAGDLLQLTHGLRQFGALRRVAKERIEHLLGRPKAALRLGDEADHRQALLRREARVAQPAWNFLVRGRTGNRLEQARRHFAGARVQIDPTPEPALERLLGEQQRRRAFQDQRFRHRRRRCGEDATGLGERLGERVNARAGQTGHRGPQCRNRLCKYGDIGRASLDQLLPRRLGARDRRARRRHRARIEATESGHLEVGRHRCVEPEGAAHLGDQRRARPVRHIGAREREQRVLHQPFGDRGAIGDRAPQLQVHARQQALSIDVELDHAIAQGLEVGQRHFPESRVPGPHLRGFDRVDRSVQ